jgi:hypothetical protein
MVNQYIANIKDLLDQMTKNKFNHLTSLILAYNITADIKAFCTFIATICG